MMVEYTQWNIIDKSLGYYQYCFTAGYYTIAPTETSLFPKAMPVLDERTVETEIL